MTESEVGATGDEAPVALVTGGVRGLGLSVARALASRGERVHIGWRSSVARALELEGEFPGRLHRADLCAPGAADELVARVVEREGRLDHVVHTVGEFESGALAELEGGRLRELLASNVESSLAVLGAARAALRASRGCAVFFGSAGASSGRAFRETAGYAAAKSALAVLVRSAAVEEAPHGVTLNMVSPGIVPHDAAHADTLDARRQERIPAGRAGRPEDVANAVLWLCSAEAAHVTGTELTVAGGFGL